MGTLISIEQHITYLTYHIILIKEGYVHTFITKQVSNAAKIRTILRCIYQNDFKGLTEFFKEEEGLLHQHITYSYGPNIRAQLKNKNKMPKEEY